MLNTPRDIEFDNTFYYQYIQEKLEMEHENHDNTDLYAPISFQELDTLIGKLKYNKATVIDKILNEVIKQNHVMILLHSLFNEFFSSTLLPSVWLKAVISPIPKCSSKDPCITLNQFTLICFEGVHRCNN